MITRFIVLRIFGKDIMTFKGEVFKNYTELGQSTLPVYTLLPFIKVKYYIQTKEGCVRL